MEREVYNHIVRILKDYPDIDRYVKDREQELMHPYHDSDNNAGVARSSGVVNPSEVMAITIATDRRLSNLERNKRIVSECLDNADPLTRQIITELYIKKHTTLTPQGVAELTHLSLSQVHRRKNGFLNQLREKIGW